MTGLLLDMVLPCRVDVSRAVITFERGEISPSLNITCLHREKHGKNVIRMLLQGENRKTLTQTEYANPDSNQILFRHLPVPFPVCPYQFRPVPRPKRPRACLQAN